MMIIIIFLFYFVVNVLHNYLSYCYYADIFNS